MADLTGKAFTRAETPVYNRKAVIRQDRKPDEAAGIEAFGEAEIWEAATKATSKIAKIFGDINAERQQEVVDRMKQLVETEFATNDELIQNHMAKMDSTDLNPHTLMTDFHANGLKTAEGTIKVKPLTEYKDYEDLDFKYKREIDKYFHTSKTTTQGNVMRQIASLSKAHTKMRLDKESMVTWQETASIMSNHNSWNKEVEAAPYIKKFLSDGGNSQIEQGAGKERALDYKKYIFNKIREGHVSSLIGKSIGAPNGKTKPSDVGVRSGLSDDAKRRINQSLNRYSDKVFAAVENNSIDLTDAQDLINSNMQLILHTEFISQLGINEDAAIAKAKKGEYEYTREFDGQYGGKGTIKFILNPKTLRPYIQAWDRKDKTPKQDLVYYAQVKNRLNSLEGQYDIGERTKKYLNDSRITHSYKAKLIEIMGSAHLQEKQRSEIEDSNAILDQIENKLIDDVDYMEKLGTIDKNGLFHPFPDSKIRNMIPDREDEVKVWVDEGTKAGPGLGGRLEAQINIVKGKNRKGVDYLLKNKDKLNNLYKTYESKTRTIQKNLMVSDVDRQMVNHSSIQGLLDDYASKDTNWTKIDPIKIDAMWNSKDELERGMVRGAFQNRAEFEIWANNVVTNANKSPDYNKKIASKLTPGHDDNDRALEAAITAQMQYDMKTYINRGVNVKAETLTKETTPPIQALLNKMREATGNENLDFTDGQRERIKLYQEAHANLVMIGTNYKTYDVPELEAQSLRILNKGENLGETITYWRNKTFADHIRAEMEVRSMELNSGELGALVLTNELREGSAHGGWRKKYPHIWNDSHSEQDNINKFLKFLSHKLQGRDSRGKEVQYFGHGKQTNLLLNMMKKRTDIVPDIDALDRRVEATKEKLMQRLVSQPQK